MSHIPEILKSLEKLELTIKTTVWPESENAIQDILLKDCEDMRKVVQTMQEELETHAKQAMELVMEKATDLHTIYYNRGRLVQIKKIIR